MLECQKVYILAPFFIEIFYHVLRSCARNFLFYVNL